MKKNGKKVLTVLNKNIKNSPIAKKNKTKEENVDIIIKYLYNKYVK